MKRAHLKKFPDLPKTGHSDIIDMHIHFGAPKDEASDCYWSDEFEKTAACSAFLLLTRSLFKKTDIHRVRRHLLKQINHSKYVSKSVLLALDQVYDENGGVHPEWTHLSVPNSYIASLAMEYERVLFGASVHPYRKDCLDELDRCLEQKAVLCKWIPSSQLINPGHKKCIPFYDKLADHNLPLLSHSGPEYAIPTSDRAFNAYNNPKYLRQALDAGVTVIIAHCALPYFWLSNTENQTDFDDLIELFEEAEKNDWNLYADISAVTGLVQLPYIEKIQELVPQERLLFGSDYPIPLSEMSHRQNTNFLSWMRYILKVTFMKNPLDLNYRIVREMGFEDTIFTNPAVLFADIDY